MAVLLRALAGLLMLSWSLPALAADALNGSYFGIDDAEGASISISPDSEGYRGIFYDARGNSQKFEADRQGDVAEAVLDMDSLTILMRMVPLPYGAEVAIIPFDGEGRLLLDSARLLNFVRQGVSLPNAPKDYSDPPRNAGETIAANAFLASYQFWDPLGVVNGYLGLPERFRPLMRMFPAVQLDVIWKLCLAPSADRALASALRGQGVACPEVLQTIANTQRTGQFNSYKAEVEDERSVLRLVVRCADGYVESKQACDTASQRLSKAAVSLRTAAGVLARYR